MSAPSASATPDHADHSDHADQPDQQRQPAQHAQRAQRAQRAKKPDATQKKRPQVPEQRHLGKWIAIGILVAFVALVAIQIVRVVRRPPQVTVAAARLEDVSRMLAVTGRLEAVQTVSVNAQFNGRITEIVRREGERVTKGEVLARLADTTARASVLQQQAELTARQFDLKQAERDLSRTSALVASGAAAKADLENARLNVARTTEDIRRLSAAVSAEKSQLVLLAPFDGMIVRRDGEIGQVVGPESTVFEVVSIDAVRVTAEVDERYVRALRRDLRAEVLPLGGNGARFAAKVDYVAQAVDPKTGAATVRFVYDQPPPQIVVGMSVDVNVSVGSVAGALTIPREAVAGGGARPFVLVERGGKVERRDVTLDDWPAPRVVVRSGLVEGEHVLVDPRSAVPGAEVRAKQGPATREEQAPTARAAKAAKAAKAAEATEAAPEPADAL